MEAIVNDVISKKLAITMEVAKLDDVRNRFAIERLPEDASDIVRIVHIGDYDECLCIGDYVNNTSEVGKFRISSTRFIDGMFRIVFRLDVEE